MDCKKTIKSESDGSRLRNYFHSLPYREMRPMRAKIAEACGVRERTVVKWILPTSYRQSFTSLQKAAINGVAGRQIF